MNGDFSRLDETKHMFGWLFDHPYEYIWLEVQNTLAAQVSGAALKRFDVTSDPDWLTVGKTQGSDSETMIVSMSAVAFEFNLDVWSEEHGTNTLAGVYTWAAANLDAPDNRTNRLWFDIGGSLEQFGSSGNLEMRMRSLKRRDIK